MRASRDTPVPSRPSQPVADDGPITLLALGERRAWGVLADGSTRELPMRGAERSASDWGRRLAEALREMKRHPEGLVVSPPWRWCFAGTVATDGMARRGRRSALLFAFESLLPVDAEALTADAVEREGAAFVVAVRHAAIRPLLDALDEAELGVAHLVPWPLLANLEGPPADQPPGVPRVLVAADPEGVVNLVRWRDTQPDAWRTVAAESGAIGDELRSLLPVAAEGEPPAAIVTQDLPEALLADLRRRCANDLCDGTGTEVPPLAQAGRRAADVLRGVHALPLDLRRDALAAPHPWARLQGALTATAVAALVLLLALSGVWIARAQAWQRHADAADDAQTALFREQFPDQPVPAALLSRYRSEAGKARGLAGSTDQRVPARPATLGALAEVLVALPDDLRYRLLELRLDGGRLYLDGQARSHGDADRLAAALRVRTGLELDAPRTQALPDRGVSYTVSGRIAAGDGP